MRKVFTFTLIAGVALVLISLVLPVIHLVFADPAATGIIGAADAPTYAFLLSQRYLWLTWLGGAATIVSIIGLIFRKS